jgi:hypothetical protein
MIDAYLDETGIHDGAPMCFISGFFGRREEWKKVDDSWRLVLDKYNVPLDKFHALEVVKRRKLFMNWEGQAHSQFMNELAGAVTEFSVYPVSFGIVNDDFYSFSENQRRFLTGMEVTPNGRFEGTGNPNKPYFTPFMHIVRQVASYAPASRHAHFFFGLDRPFHGYAQEIFNILKSSPNRNNFRDRLGDLSAPNAKETPQLQAADFLTYLTYDHARDCLKAGDWHLRAVPALESLVRKARSLNDLVYYNNETMTAMLMKLPAEIRALLE